MKAVSSNSITILLPAGRLPLEIMAATHRLARQHGLRVYLSTLQNLRLTDIPAAVIDEVRAELSALGAEFKAHGRFPIPRVCLGEKYCQLGTVDTEEVSSQLLARFGGRYPTKAKFKIAISGCTMCCSGVKTTDIGIMASREGFELYAGGKGGPNPRVGRRIGRRLSLPEVLEMMDALVTYHDAKTVSKQRIFKLLEEPDFPFPEV